MRLVEYADGFTESAINQVMMIRLFPSFMGVASKSPAFFIIRSPLLLRM